MNQAQTDTLAASIREGLQSIGQSLSEGLQVLTAALEARPDLSDSPEQIRASYWHMRYHQLKAELDDASQRLKHAEERLHIETKLLADHRNRDEWREVANAKAEQLDKTLAIIRQAARAQTLEEGQAIQEQARVLLAELEGAQVPA